MGCHLIDLAKEGKLTHNNLKNQTWVEESILESSHLDVGVVKCVSCGQLFICCFREYTSPDWEDDMWTFWIPATAEDIAGVKKNIDELSGFMEELISKRSHICWGPNNKVSWVDGGCAWSSVIFG
ncbi:hypothetical protein M0R36_03245 [bacterium]|nr:hypothetical protein [bacterium]